MVKPLDREPPAIELLREAANRLRSHGYFFRTIADMCVREGPQFPWGEMAEALAIDAKWTGDLAARIETFLAERARLLEKPAPFEGARIEL